MSCRQILFCVETNKNARTDWVYIEATIKRFYIDDRKIVYRPIFMGSKSMYRDTGLNKEIKTRIDKYPGETTVVYCIDVDDYDASPVTAKLNESIKNFCIDKNFEFVFFSRDIEDVYLSRVVNDSEKIKCAETFNRKKMIANIDEKLLSKNTIKGRGSNVLIVLNKL